MKFSLHWHWPVSKLHESVTADPAALQSQATDKMCVRLRRRLLRDGRALTSAVGNDRIAKVAGFAFLTVPSDGVAETIDTLPGDIVARGFVAVARFTSRTDR